MNTNSEFKTKLIEYLNLIKLPYENSRDGGFPYLIIQGYKFQLSQPSPFDDLKNELTPISDYLIGEIFKNGVKIGKNYIRSEIKTILKYD